MKRAALLAAVALSLAACGSSPGVVAPPPPHGPGIIAQFGAWHFTLCIIGYFIVGLLAARLFWQVFTSGDPPNTDHFTEGWMAAGALFLWPLIVPVAVFILVFAGISFAITWKPGQKQ